MIYSLYHSNFFVCIPEGSNSSHSAQVGIKTTFNFVRVTGAYAAFQAVSRARRNFLPGTEEILVQYLSGYLVDEASEDEDILQVARYMLESIAMDKPDVRRP
jgi:hypothetical protein